MTFTPVRVVCANTLTAALSGAHHAVYVRHTKNVATALAAAARIVGASETYWARFREACQRLAAQDVNREEVRTFLRELFPDRVTEDGDVVPTAQVLSARQRVLALFEGEGTGADMAGATRWNLYNSAIEFVERHRPVRGSTNRLEASLLHEGQAALLRQRALDLLLAPSLT